MHHSLVARLLRQLAHNPDLTEAVRAMPELNDLSAREALAQAANWLEQAQSPEPADPPRPASWLFSEIVEHIPEMLFVKDAQDLRYVRVNRAAEVLLGLSREEMLGKDDFELFLPHEAAFFREKDRAVLEQGQVLDIPEEEIATRAGELLLHTKKIAIRDAQGVPRFLVGISRDITAFKKAQSELLASQLELRRLSGQLQQAQEEERLRLARELHDELGQVLTGLKIELAWLEERVHESHPGLLIQMQETRVLVDSAMTTVRRVATALRPQILDNLGLRAALDWLSQEICGRARLTAVLDYNLAEEVEQELAITIFRICQEALTNVVRHAKARNVRICLQQKTQALLLEIIDDGEGFDPSRASKNSLGLVGIRERALLWGGRVEVESPRLGGTRIAVELPRVHRM